MDDSASVLIHAYVQAQNTSADAIRKVLLGDGQYAFSYYFCSVKRRPGLILCAEDNQLDTWDSSFLRIHVPHVSTFMKESAFLACRPLGMANLPSMPDQVDMQRVHPFWRGHFGKQRMRRISIHVRPN